MLDLFNAIVNQGPAGLVANYFSGNTQPEAMFGSEENPDALCPVDFPVLGDLWNTAYLATGILSTLVAYKMMRRNGSKIAEAATEQLDAFSTQVVSSLNAQLSSINGYLDQKADALGQDIIDIIKGLDLKVMIKGFLEKNFFGGKSEKDVLALLTEGNGKLALAELVKGFVELAVTKNEKGDNIILKRFAQARKIRGQEGLMDDVVNFIGATMKDRFAQEAAPKLTVK